MTAPKFCPQCGAALLLDSPNGICPRCAFQVAMDSGGRGSVDPTLQAGGRSEGQFVPPKPKELAQHFPQLEILDLIGQGGMGAVYKARQKGLDRIVAVKILPPDSAHDPAFAERFGREARALARLNHPNIVSVYDSGQAGGLYYFIMEYVGGVNLRQAIQAGQLSAKEALAIVPQVCDALQYAHDEGIVHRDIKPENVLIDGKGRVKIADFGLARLLGKNADNFTLTGARQVMGTPRYMAPEQLEGTHDVDHRADIYSLGVVFYEMLTGELPLGRFAAPSKKVEIDVRLDEVVLRTLEKEPDRRYQQAGDIKTAVQTIVGPASLPPHLQRMYGREYRSKLQIFGIPLVHIATGINPATNQRRIAKGIIAIGDQAFGVLAIGGMACGLVAIGGAALGGVSLGGVSIGLMLAIGGGAIGFGAAMGGLAIAPVAVGGCAIGYYAAGGAGFGMHAVSGNSRDPVASAFFRNAANFVLTMLPVVGISVSILTVLAVLLACAKAVAASVTGTPGSDPRAAIKPRDENVRSRGAGVVIGCIAVLVLLFLGTILVGLSGFVYFGRASSIRAVEAERNAAQAQQQAAHARMAESAAQLQSRLANRSRQENLNWTDEGPAVSDLLQQQLAINDQLRDQVNQVLRDVFRGYLAVESIHSELVIVGGHQRTTIRIPAEKIDKLQQQLWSRLDAIFNPKQQADMRRLVPVQTLNRMDLVPGDTANDLVFPGVLGWGAAETTIDILRQGEWFEWKITSQGFSQNGNSHGLDPRWKRFWVEPANANQDSKSESQSVKSSQ